MDRDEMIGNFFKVCRLEARMSVESLAKRTGISAEEILEYEAGEREWDEDIMATFMIGFGVNPAAILNVLNDEN